MEQQDLFGAKRFVELHDNPTLQKMAERVYAMYEADKTISNGDSVGQIDRKICALVWLDDGLNNLIHSDQKEEFLKIMAKASEAEVITRARRWLTEKNYLPLPAPVIRKSEQQRMRISGAMR